MHAYHLIQRALLDRLDIPIALRRAPAAVVLGLEHRVLVRDEHERVLLVPLAQPRLRARRDCAHGVLGHKRDYAADARVHAVLCDEEVCEAGEGVADAEEEYFGGVVGSGVGAG